MRKLIALLLVTGILVFALTGCGFLKTAKDIKDGLDDIGDIIGDPDDDDDDDEDEGAETVFSGTAYYPEDSKTILRDFSEFGYEVSGEDEDGNSQFWSIHYVYEGDEEVDGDAASVLTVTKVENGETLVETHWYNEDGRLVKAMKDGEEISDWEAITLGMFLGLYANKASLTTTVVDEDGKIKTFSYSLEDERSEGSDVGEMDVYEIKSKFVNVLHVYGLVEKAGDIYFVLLRSEVPGTDVFEQLLVTHMEFR